MADSIKFSAPIRWGIIGCGNVTEVKSGPAYKQTDGFELTAVMRRDPDKLKDYAKRHNIAKHYTSAKKLIADDEIDAVYIATPPDTHRYYALKVAEAGKPCCIEKPLSPCHTDSLAIHEAFKNKGIPLFVAYYRRSLPRFNQVNTWLKNNEIGEIRHISWCLNKAPNATDLSGTYNWRTDPKVAPGGYFDDLASHGLDLFIFLLGDIQQVFGLSLNQQQLYLAKDAVAACWVHQGGVTGTGSWNFGCEDKEDRVEIFGSKGKVQFSVFEENPLILERNGDKQEFFIENPKNIQLYHVENMKKHLLEENYDHPSNGRTATHTSWVMDKILGI
ncbi:Gfo/Idh/MocA family protein [Spongiimicrobium sp. 3-5]|uniref:Gfo/Idh/MocA family protein n=1 Tax=Spongiimicrobium sp. 3-5 TaxID=3332596 RepID=UPI00397F2669